MPHCKNITVNLDRRDRATIVAALMHWRKMEDPPEDLVIFVTDFSAYPLWIGEQINQLIVRINGEQ